MEGGSPGNTEGVHQSGSRGLEPEDSGGRGVSGSRGGGKCWSITLVGGGWAKVRQTKRKASVCVCVLEGGVDSRKRWSEQRKRVSQEAYVGLQRQDDGFWCAQTDTGRQGSLHVTHSHTYTHILSYYTNTCLHTFSTVWPLITVAGCVWSYPVLGQPGVESLHIAHVLWLWRRERERERETVPNCSWFFPWHLF